MDRATSARGSLPSTAALVRPALSRWAPWLLVAAAAVAAYGGVHELGFVFDDDPAIVRNAALQAGDWWGAAFGEPHQPLANRPLACLSLVLDLLVHGPGPFGPHLTNLLLHIGNALLVFVLARGALRGANLAARFSERRATWLGAAVAAIWAAHPLGADAVAYATQRSTLLFSGGLLLALEAARRAHTAPRPSRWRALAVAAMAASMASKEDAVAGPFLVVLFERAFLVPSWSALRAHRGFHAALAATWLVLAGCVWLGPANPTVGYGTAAGTTAPQWLMTQAGVVMHYLACAVWPHPLRGIYDWDIVTDLGRAVVPGLAVMALLALCVLAWRRQPWWGWLGALFFLLLAPTSSVMPIVSEVVAERRAYLPMLLVLVPAVLGAQALLARATAGAGPGLLPWLGGALVAAAVASLAAVTRAHVGIYRDPMAFWTDAHAKRNPAGRGLVAGQILSSQGVLLWQQGRLEEANACFDEAMQCGNPGWTTRLHYGESLDQRGRRAEAVVVLRQVVVESPADADALGALGACLVGAAMAERAKADDPRLAEAEDLLRRALAQQPDRTSSWNALGYVLRIRGKYAEAERAYQRATEQVEHVEPYFARAMLLEALGRGAEIGPMFQRLLQARPRDAAVRVRLADICAQRQDFAAAEQLARDALRVEPGNATAAALLQRLQARSGR